MPCGLGWVATEHLSGVALLPRQCHTSGALGMAMRIVFFASVGLLMSVGAAPSFAQAIRATEPLVLEPYESALVRDGSCVGGKVLKVTGAIRGLRRKKMCISLGDAQASLGSLFQ
jgi:hypothetical protein